VKKIIHKWIAIFSFLFMAAPLDVIAGFDGARNGGKTAGSGKIEGLVSGGEGRFCKLFVQIIKTHLTFLGWAAL
jgi:hypothetical protein